MPRCGASLWQTWGVLGDFCEAAALGPSSSCLDGAGCLQAGHSCGSRGPWLSCGRMKLPSFALLSSVWAFPAKLGLTGDLPDHRRSSSGSENHDVEVLD